MSLLTLVEKIRKEEVALFVGSGMSLYAGYKGAWELKELIYNKVESYCNSEAEKLVAKSKNLLEISELLIRYTGSRDELNKILIQEYKKKPEATYLHDRLSRIPHFEHIFTTNYDTLLEDSMLKRCHVIGSINQFPIQSNSHPKVYKLHGDVNNLEGIIIATRDYSKATADQKEHIVWNRLKDVCAYKDILFLGHSFEDSNIWEIFHELEKNFKHLHRSKYMVCPNLPDNQQRYLKSIGFVNINMAAEAFLDYLYPQLIEHAISDCETKQLSLSTFERFLNLNDKNVIVKTEDQRIRVEAILELDGSYNADVSFTIVDDIHQQFIKFQEGTVRQKSFTIAQKDLVDFSMQMSGFKFPLDAATMEALELVYVPDELRLSIESEDGHVEYSNLQLKRYRFPDGANLEFNIHNAVFTLCCQTLEKGVNITVKLDLPKSFNDVIEAEQVLTFITYMFTGRKLDFYLNNESHLPIQNQKPHEVKFGVWKAEKVLEHLEHLRFLERKFKIKFSNITIEQLSEQIIAEVEFLYEMFTKGFVERPMDKVFIIEGELTRYSPYDDDSEPDQHKNLIIETPRIFKFYDQPLPALFLKYEVLEGEFVKHENKYALTSRVKKIRHKVMLENEFLEFLEGKKETINIEDLVQDETSR